MMRHYVLLSSLLMWAAGSVAAQSGAGSITGQVMDPEGAAFSGAFVQLKNEVTSGMLNAVSGKDGSYEFTEVPAGKYEVTVNVPGMETYRHPGTVVKPGEKLRLDAKVEDGPSLRTLGEDPAA